MRKIPVVSIIGKKNSGKTTLIEKIIPELKKRNYRVGVIKHSHHRFEMDHEGKDTFRMTRAGGDTVVIVSGDQTAMIKKTGEMSANELVACLFPDVDIVITEGFKRGDTPKIEVNRKEISQELVCMPEELLAVVSDQAFEAGVPSFFINDATAVAAFIVEKMIAHGDR